MVKKLETQNTHSLKKASMCFLEVGVGLPGFGGQNSSPALMYVSNFQSIYLGFFY